MTKATLVLSVPPGLAGHVAVALRRHRQWAVKQAVQVPSGFVALERTFTDRATEGQRGTPLQDFWEFADARVMSPKLLTYEAAAAALSVSVRQVKRLVAAKQISAVQVLGATRIRACDLEDFVAGLDIKGAS